MNEPLLKVEPATISSTEFFARARTRLTFDVPPGLVDPNVIPRTGDSGNDRMQVFFFLVVFAFLMYFTKRKVWANAH